MSTAIAKWGNAVGLRIPQPYLRQLGLSVGDTVEIEISQKKMIVSKSGPSLEELLAQCSPENAHDEYFSEPYGAELL